MERIVRGNSRRAHRLCFYRFRLVDVAELVQRGGGAWTMLQPEDGFLPEDKVYLAYFHAPWCGVCHEKAPVVDQIAASAKLQLTRWDIESDAGRAEAERRRIETVPTLALINGERVPFRLIGRMITPENARFLLERFTTPP